MNESPFFYFGEDSIYCYDDYFAYHVTERKNIFSIKEQGLESKTGERCKRIKEDIKGIFFTDNIYGVKSWIEMLYPDIDIKTLILLKFNLMNRTIHYKSRLSDDYYTLTNRIEPEKLSYLEILKNNQQMYLNDLLKALIYEKEYRLIWHPLKNLKLENTYNSK